jgi:hypothetical protein
MVPPGINSSQSMANGPSSVQNPCYGRSIHALSICLKLLKGIMRHYRKVGHGQPRHFKLSAPETEPGCWCRRVAHCSRPSEKDGDFHCGLSSLLPRHACQKLTSSTAVSRCQERPSSSVHVLNLVPCITSPRRLLLSLIIDLQNRLLLMSRSMCQKHDIPSQQLASNPDILVRISSK